MCKRVKIALKITVAIQLINLLIQDGFLMPVMNCTVINNIATVMSKIRYMLLKDSVHFVINLCCIHIFAEPS